MHLLTVELIKAAKIICGEAFPLRFLAKTSGILSHEVLAIISHHLKFVTVMFTTDATFRWVNFSSFIGTGYTLIMIWFLNILNTLTIIVCSKYGFWAIDEDVNS